MKNVLIPILIIMMFIITASFGINFKQINQALQVNQDTINTRESIYINMKFNITADKWKWIVLSSQELETQPEFIALIIQHESHFKTTATNPYSNAVGLIQFMPSTLKWMGYSTDSVYNMNFEQQMKLVVDYYKKFKGYNFDNPIKLFLTTFYPYGLRVWNNEDYIFGSEKSMNYAYKVASINNGFDLNKDGLITMKEYKLYHVRYITK